MIIIGLRFLIEKVARSTFYKKHIKKWTGHASYFS